MKTDKSKYATLLYPQCGMDAGYPCSVLWQLRWDGSERERVGGLSPGSNRSCGLLRFFIFIETDKILIDN